MKLGIIPTRFSRSLTSGLAAIALLGGFFCSTQAVAQPPSPQAEIAAPQRVSNKVLVVASKQLGIPVNQLRVATSRPAVWDGCLGVASPSERCQMIAIPGWQMIVVAPQQYWVYHANQTADLIKLNPTTSGRGELVPTFWQPEVGWLPGTSKDVIFQSVTTGGFAGMNYKTVLLKNGRVLRIDLRRNAIASPTLIRKLSRQQVQQFVQTLKQNEFEDFLGFDYPANRGAADYFTIALATSSGQRATRYADIVQNEMPRGLQKIIQAWNRMTSRQ